MLKDGFIYSSHIENGIYEFNFEKDNIFIRPIGCERSKFKFIPYKYIDDYISLFENKPISIYIIRLLDSNTIEIKDLYSIRGEGVFNNYLKEFLNVSLDQSNIRSYIFNNFIFLNTFYNGIIGEEILNNIYKEGVNGILRKGKMEIIKFIAKSIVDLRGSENIIDENKCRVEGLLELIDEYDIKLNVKEKKKFMKYISCELILFNLDHNPAKMKKDYHNKINHKNLVLFAKLMHQLEIFTEGLYDYIFDLVESENSQLYNASLAFILRYLFSYDEEFSLFSSIDNHFLFNIMTFPKYSEKVDLKAEIVRLNKEINYTINNLKCYNIDNFYTVFNYMNKEGIERIKLSPYFIKFIEEDLYNILDEFDCLELAKLMIKNKVVFYNSKVNLKVLLTKYMDCNSKEYKQFVFKEDLLL